MPRYMPDNWPLPAIDDLDRPFFTSGGLMIQQCADCGTLQHPPEEVCFACQSFRFTHVRAAGTGTVHSYTVVHHPTSPLLAQRVPYAVALVQLSDLPQIRVLGNVLNVDPAAVKIGM